MTDYKKLVEDLRETAKHLDGISRFPYDDDPAKRIYSKKMNDAADAIEALQAEVERLKDSNEELREKQTYIDHYGDKWMTSAKDVPTDAYKHGYADGWAEARAKMEEKC